MQLLAWLGVANSRQISPGDGKLFTLERDTFAYLSVGYLSKIGFNEIQSRLILADCEIDFSNYFWPVWVTRNSISCK